MGRKTTEIRATARLSDHFDEQDELDRQAWERFVATVRELAEREEYAELNISIDDQGSW